MTERHKKGSDGQFLDDVDAVLTSKVDLGSYDVAGEGLHRLRVPTLLHKDATDERLFVANFDGTGNDAGGDREHMTNVAHFADDLSEHVDPRVVSRYLPGPGTQSLGLFAVPDAAWGISNDARVREMYRQFSSQVRDWLIQNPNADIRLVAIGFSRGSEEAAAFTRMVHERGVQVPEGNRMRQLIPPGKIPQAVGLFDPVGTGHPRAHDRHLASSVVSGIQIVAKDEKRTLFPSTMIIPRGRSDDGRFLGVTVAGSHSDIGGSYHRDGLALSNRALMADYLNSLSEGDLVRRPALYSSIAQYDTHRSQDHASFYFTGAYDRLGERDTFGAQRHPPHCRPVEKCAPPDPMDEALEAKIGPRHAVTVGETPLDVIGRDIVVAKDLKPGDAEHPLARQAPDAEQTRADIMTRTLSPEASWADHHQSTQPSAQERDNHIDFSRFPRLDSNQSAQEREIRFEPLGRRRDEPDATSQNAPDRNSPTHPAHRDHALYNSVHDKLTTLHAEEGIKLSDQQMDRLALCSVATAKQCGMKDVSHVSLGQDRQGNVLPEVHLYQAFRGDIDDPRTKWGKVEALEAFQTPEHVASQHLQVANQQMDQFQQDQQVRMSQEQSQGLSMSR